MSVDSYKNEVIDKISKSNMFVHLDFKMQQNLLAAIAALKDQKKLEALMAKFADHEEKIEEMDHKEEDKREKLNRSVEKAKKIRELSREEMEESKQNAEAFINGVLTEKKKSNAFSNIIKLFLIVCITGLIYYCFFLYKK